MKGQADDDSTLIFSDEIFERLSNVPLFEPLSDEETDQLAKKCLSRIFAPGEAIVRKGQKGASMYVVHRGSVKIQLRENNAPKTVATLSEGEFFGEMGLFTGEPRRADVVAAEETEVLEITHEAVKPLLDDNPDLAGGLAETIARRSEMLAESLAEAEADTAMKQRGVFDSIKNFFGLK
jgi:CRP-like cAMP-binding protein